MPEEKIREIASAANLVVNGYAMLQDGARVKVVHLYTGRVVVVDETQGVIESSMDEMGTTHPEMATPTTAGTPVFTCARLPFRMPLADGRGLSALTVHMAGCVKDSPWNAYDDGLAYVDNVRVEREVPGMVILVR